MSLQITITGKQIKNFLIWSFCSLAVVLLSWFALCDRIAVQAQGYVYDKVDKRYPTVHAPCSTKVAKIELIQEKQMADVSETKASVKVLLMMSRGRLTYDEKQRIVDSLVKRDSLTYDQAYRIIDGR